MCVCVCVYVSVAYDDKSIKFRLKADSRWIKIEASGFLLKVRTGRLELQSCLQHEYEPA